MEVKQGFCCDKQTIFTISELHEVVRGKAKGRNTQAQPLDIWSIWRDQDQVGNNMFGAFSGVERFQTRVDVVGFDSTCEVWGGWLSDVWAIGFSDWRCASESARCVGGAEYCVCFGFLSTLFRHFLFSCFGVLTRDQLLLCPFTTN